MSLESAFGRKLYQARIEHGFTQAHVAEKALISIRWYQKLEKGVFLPGNVLLLRLLILLELDPNDFRKEVGLVDDLSVSSC